MSETKPPEDKLQIGDVVQVKSINTRLSGLVGVIKSRQQTYPFSFEVDIEGERELQSFHPDNLIKCVPLPVGPSVAVERCAVCKHEGPRDPNTGICLWSNPVDEFDGSCGHGCTTFEPVDSQPRCSGNCKTQEGEHDADCPYYVVDSLRTEGRPPNRTRIHLTHCNLGEYIGLCKYSDEDCPALRPDAPLCKLGAAPPECEQIPWCETHGQFMWACERDNAIKLPQSPGDVPERIWLRKAERDGHQVWMQASGTDEGELEFIRADLAQVDKQPLKDAK